MCYRNVKRISNESGCDASRRPSFQFPIRIINQCLFCIGTEYKASIFTYRVTTFEHFFARLRWTTAGTLEEFTNTLGKCPEGKHFAIRATCIIIFHLVNAEILSKSLFWHLREILFRIYDENAMKTNHNICFNFLKSKFIWKLRRKKYRKIICMSRFENVHGVSILQRSNKHDKSTR